MKKRFGMKEEKNIQVSMEQCLGQMKMKATSFTKEWGEVKEKFEVCSRTSSIYREKFYLQLLDGVAIIHTSKAL